MKKKLKTSKLRGSITTYNEIVRHNPVIHLKDMKKKKYLTANELGLLGGSSTFKKHGRKHYIKMAMARYHPEEYAKKYGKGK